MIYMQECVLNYFFMSNVLCYYLMWSQMVRETILTSHMESSCSKSYYKMQTIDDATHVHFPSQPLEVEDTIGYGV